MIRTSSFSKRKALQYARAVQGVTQAAAPPTLPQPPPRAAGSSPSTVTAADTASVRSPDAKASPTLPFWLLNTFLVLFFFSSENSWLSCSDKEVGGLLPLSSCSTAHSACHTKARALGGSSTWITSTVSGSTRETVAEVHSHLDNNGLVPICFELQG